MQEPITQAIIPRQIIILKIQAQTITDSGSHPRIKILFIPSVYVLYEKPEVNKDTLRFIFSEMREGFTAGIIFVAIDFILDMVLFVIPHRHNMIFIDYHFHVFSMIIMTLLITTFLGYLAQMNIDLK
jgi:hypothetical protein